MSEMIVIKRPYVLPMLILVWSTAIVPLKRQSDRSRSIPDTLEESAKLLASDGASGDSFGRAVALDGGRALVGANNADVDGNNTGVVYVFEFDGNAWMETARLTADDGGRGDSFGRSVSLDGDRALIGAPGDDVQTGIDAGSAYVFDFDGTAWSQTAKLLAGDGVELQRFGRTVSLDGDRALVGAPAHDGSSGTVTGAAYAFEFDAGAWSETARLSGSGSAPDDGFAWSVSLNGDRALIGAPFEHFEDLGLPDVGSAYVFDLNGDAWVERVQLWASDSQIDMAFGWSVALDENRSLIGAHLYNFGAAYVYDYDGANWQESKLAPSATTRGRTFGWSVALSDDRALMGDHFDEEVGIRTGSAFVFDFDGDAWAEGEKLVAGDAVDNEQFGWSVALDGDRVLVGSPGDDERARNAGAAYIYDVPTPTSAEPTDDLPPKRFDLGQNYPNPFHRITHIDYTLFVPAPVRLSVYTIDGREIATLVDGLQPAGKHQVIFEASGLSGGTYLYRLETTAGRIEKTMVLAR